MRPMSGLISTPALACLGLLALPAHAQLSLDDYVSTGIDASLAIVVPDDGSQRMFVAERDGDIKLIDMPTRAVISTYISINVTASNEQGLLGLAFDPNFNGDPLAPGYGEFYAAFTAPASDPKLGDDADQVLRRYTVSDPTADIANVSSAVDVMRIPDWTGNHNGADLHFGPDGFLYFSMGDGGSGGDPHDFAQNTGRKLYNGNEYYLLGKMIRIDVHDRGNNITNAHCGASFAATSPAATAEYGIPPGNPFAGSLGGDCGEIWLYGLRNPYRFSFDRHSGDLFIGDVGQGAYEEIDWLPAGPVANPNLGWRLCEGFHHYNPGGSGNDCPTITNTFPPILEYDHNQGDCSVTGGVLYNGPIQALQGKYIYGDFCTGRIWAATRNGNAWSASEILDASGNVVAFGEDTDGNLYVAELGGAIRVITSDIIFVDGFEAN